MNYGLDISFFTARRYDSAVNKVSKQCIASINLAFTATGNSHAIWGSHSVTCHPTDARIPPLPPAEAGTRFSDPGGIQG